MSPFLTSLNQVWPWVPWQPTSAREAVTCPVSHRALGPVWGALNNEGWNLQKEASAGSGARPSAWAGSPLRAPALSRACRGPKVGEAQTPSAACSALSPLPSAASPGTGEASGKQKQEVCLPDSSWAPQPSGAQEHWGLALRLELELGLGADDHTDSFRGLPWLQCEAWAPGAGTIKTLQGWPCLNGGGVGEGGYLQVESLHSPASSISPSSTKRTGGPSLLISALRALISEARWQSCSCLHPASMTSK